MTIKLMKYELRASMRVLAPLWSALLVLGILNRVVLMSETMQEFWNGIPAVLLTILFVVGVIATSLTCIVFLILRFYRSFMKDEGYLMFTLPVKTGQLLNAKLISAYLLTLTTGLVCIGGVALMLLGNEAIEGAWTLLRLVSQSGEMPFDQQTIGGISLIYTLLLLIAPVEAILRYYLAMAIGQLSNKSKGGISVVVYLGLNAVETGVMQGVSWLTLAGPLQKLTNSTILDETMMLNSVMNQMQISFCLILAAMTIMAALFYFLTWWILKNKLNLQ